MAKEEKDLFLKFVAGARIYNTHKNVVVKKVSKSKGRYKNAIYVYSAYGLEDKREFPYPFIKEMKKNHYYTIGEVLKMLRRTNDNIRKSN